jgi:hypothetical protein
VELRAPSPLPWLLPKFLARGFASQPCAWTAGAQTEAITISSAGTAAIAAAGAGRAELARETRPIVRHNDGSAFCVAVDSCWGVLLGLAYL